MWTFSSSVKELVFSMKYFNAVALAALVAKLTFVDSTLMQKALGVYSEVDTTPIEVYDIQGYITTEWPNTGSVENSVGDSGYMQPWTINTYKLWRMSGGVYPSE